ncbi:hypothetical protein AYO49_01675 [Verrucomicrobiaceae bacterium SCGC AG-212-N21]|nr:hypothetical protein AYO49_01675 [Verrucomicrobiaceae bacterium SCGC AG-212-N21]
MLALRTRLAKRSPLMAAPLKALPKLQNSLSRSELNLTFVRILEYAGMRFGVGTTWLIAALILLGSTWAQEPAGAKIDQQNKAGWGAFVSFDSGTLTLKGSGGGLVWNEITDKTEVFHWDDAARAYLPGNPGEVLGKVKPGTWIFVADNKTFIRVGAEKEGHVTGSFVSFKNDVMLLLGKDLPVSNFTKKYGNQLKFPKFAENVPVFESIDGEDYTLAGTPAATLPKIKEGTLVTVYFGPADGSVIRIEIGVKKGKATAADSLGKNTPAPEATDQKDKWGYGKFVSFQNGTLRLKGNYSPLVWHNIPEKIEVVRWDDAAGKYVPAGTAEVLSKVEAGTWIIVGDKKSLIRVGARKGRTTGTFVSFKDERLLMLGKDLGPSYTKKYGNQLHMNKFAEGVPVYESIDGGEFEFAGYTAEVLPKVKEGAIITVYGAGDDNITRIEIGAPKAK